MSFYLFLKDEDGQAIVEYALLTCMLVLAAYGAIKLFVVAWQARFNKIKQLRAGPLGVLP